MLRASPSRVPACNLCLDLLVVDLWTLSTESLSKHLLREFDEFEDEANALDGGPGLFQSV